MPTRYITAPTTTKRVYPSSLQKLSMSSSEHCSCRKGVNLQLVCKICGKEVQFKLKKLVGEAKRGNKCPFCPAKFTGIKFSREHVRNVHFPSTPVKPKKKPAKVIHKSVLEEEKWRENNEIRLQKAKFKRTGLYDPDEIIESLSEGENDPIKKEISSNSSNSEEKKSETVINPYLIGDPEKVKRCNSEFQQMESVNPMEATEASGSTLVQSNVKEYIAKDKTVWTTLEPPKIETKEYSIFREDGQLLGKAADPSLSPAELFKLLVSPDIVDSIVKYTNIYAENIEMQETSPDTNNQNIQKSQSKPNDLYLKPTTQEEIYAFIGMLLYLGLEKKDKIPLKECWNENGKYNIPCITATMSRGRFRILTTYLRFDDQVVRRKALAEGLKPEKLSYVSEIFNPFVVNIGSYLQPYETLVVDELLVKFRGTSKFRLYMKSNPGKYGIKIWACCDTKTGYILRLIIYEGKQEDKVKTELGRKVVLKLVKKYFGTGRGVTTDTFFTSKALAHDLMRQNMSLLGTLNKNSMDIIPDFAEKNYREVDSSMFAFQNDLTMVSYIPRENRSVVLLSTQHHTIETNPTRRNKPQMILDYNKTKGAVDTADQMIGISSCQRTSERWPMKIFYAMCDIGALNAFYIWKIHQRNLKKPAVRRQFLRLLSEALMEPLINIRANTGLRLQANTKIAMELMGYPIPRGPMIPNNRINKLRGVCGICKEQPRKRTTKACTDCRKWICKPHTAVLPTVCIDCNPFANNDLNTANTIEKKIKKLKNEGTFLPSIVNFMENIHTTPVKDSEKNEHSLEKLKPKGLCKPTKKIKSFKLNDSIAKTKLSPRNLFNELETQQTQSAVDRPCSPIGSLDLEPPEVISINNFCPKIDSPEIFTHDMSQNNTFSNPTFIKAVPIIEQSLHMDVADLPEQTPKNALQSTYTSPPLVHKQQKTVAQSSSQPKLTNILPFMPTRCVQPRHYIVSQKLMNSSTLETNRIQGNYLLRNVNNPAEVFVFKQKMVLKPNPSSSVNVTPNTLALTGQTTVFNNVIPKPQITPTKLVETIDISDDIEEHIPDVVFGKGIETIDNLSNLKETVEKEPVFDDYLLR